MADHQYVSTADFAYSLEPRGKVEGENAMAKLLQNSPGDVTAERLRARLMRLSSKYDVFIFRNEGAPDGVKVRKSAFMAIMVNWVPSGDEAEFRTSYEPGSLTLAFFLAVLLIPIILYFRLSRSPSRYEMEAEVIEAIKDEWPEVIFPE